MGTARVEVAEVGTVPLLEGLASLLEVVALGIDVVGDDILDDGLGAAVGVGGADGAVFGDGDHVLEAGGIAVDGGGGGEDDVGDIVAGHGAHKGDAAADVDAVVLEGNLARLADGLQIQLAEVEVGQQMEDSYLQGGKVNDRVNGGVLGEDIVEGLLVGDVDLVEVGAAAADELDAVEGDLGGVVEVVDNDDVVAVLKENQRREGANVARSAGIALAS